LDEQQLDAKKLWFSYETLGLSQAPEERTIFLNRADTETTSQLYSLRASKLEPEFASTDSDVPSLMLLHRGAHSAWRFTATHPRDILEVRAQDSEVSFVRYHWSGKEWVKKE